MCFLGAFVWDLPIRFKVKDSEVNVKAKVDAFAQAGRSVVPVGARQRSTVAGFPHVFLGRVFTGR